MNKILRYILILLAMCSVNSIFAQDKNLGKNIYAALYKGEVYSSSKHTIDAEHNNYSDTSSKFRATGIGLGYSINPRWSAEAQYQYIATFKAKARIGNHDLDELRGYEIKNKDNKINLEISFIGLDVKWDYFINNLYNGKISIALGFAGGIKYTSLDIDDGGEIADKKYRQFRVVLQPFIIGYQFKDFLLSFQSTIWNLNAYNTNQFGIGYYFL